MKLNLLSLVFLIIFISVAFAVPVEISYQGYLTDSGGAPVTGTTNITFKLYDNLDAVQWDSGAVAVDVESGVYSVTLGAVPQPAIDPAIFNQALWLGIAVEGDAEMTPKQKLTSVGFSIRALTADSVADGAVTDASITGPISASKIEQGSTSGLNADLLDGLESSSFAASVHSHGFSDITGTVNDSQLSGNYSGALVFSNASNLFTGSGSGLTALNASQLAQGTVPSNRLSGTYSGALTFSNITSASISSLTAGTINSGDITSTTNLNLPETTTTTGMIKFGSSPMIHAYGTYSFFAGLYSGNLSMSGNHNTAVGAGTLYSNVQGSYNTANGAYALGANTSGNYNTASGSSSLALNTQGTENAALGYSALSYNSTGSYNTAGGSGALFSNTTASKNTAVGTYSLYSQSFNNSGTPWDTHNTAVGFEALRANQPTATFNGMRNTAIGSFALRANTTGYYNVASGYSALYSNTTGYRNTASGDSALFSNSIGNNNTAAGNQALYSNTSGNYNTAAGLYALYMNGSGSYNTANGHSAMYQNSTGTGNTASGESSLISNSTGSNNTAVGYYADVASGDLYNATAIGANALVDASNHVRIGDDNVTQIGGQVAWSNLSDVRQKEYIHDLGYGLGLILALRPVEFRLKNGNDRIDFGFIAQDIEALLGTDYNVLGIGSDADRTLSVRYADFIAPMVKAIQEQNKIIEELQAENAIFKALLCLDHPEAEPCQ